jgi:hypothetical protein
LEQAAGLTAGVGVSTNSAVVVGWGGRVGRTWVGVGVEVMVAGGGVGVRVDAVRGPVVTVGVGSGVTTGLEAMGLPTTKTATITRRMTAEIATLRP